MCVSVPCVCVVCSVCAQTVTNSWNEWRCRRHHHRRQRSKLFKLTFYRHIDRHRFIVFRVIEYLICWDAAVGNSIKTNLWNNSSVQCTAHQKHSTDHIYGCLFEQYSHLLYLLFPTRVAERWAAILHHQHSTAHTHTAYGDIHLDLDSLMNFCYFFPLHFIQCIVARKYVNGRRSAAHTIHCRLTRMCTSCTSATAIPIKCKYLWIGLWTLEHTFHEWLLTSATAASRMTNQRYDSLAILVDN